MRREEYAGKTTLPRRRKTWLDFGSSSKVGPSPSPSKPSRKSGAGKTVRQQPWSRLQSNKDSLRVAQPQFFQDYRLKEKEKNRRGITVPSTTEPLDEVTSRFALTVRDWTGSVNKKKKRTFLLFPPLFSFSASFSNRTGVTCRQEF